MAFNFTVDVSCKRPSWVFDPIVFSQKEHFQFPIYRLYIDNDLITERTWIWSDSDKINEEFWIDIEPRTQHSIRLEAVLNNPAQAKFILENFKIKNGQFNSRDRINHTNIKFSI